MRAKMRSEIVSIRRDEDGNVCLKVEAKGKTISHKAGSNKDCRLEGEIILRPVFANDIKIGAVITVEVNDEEPGDRIE
jgi:hypothetical protein